MANSSFWLVHVDNSYATVGLCQIVDGRPNLTSIGQPFPWTSLEPESIIAAVDESLSQASSQISLPEDEEPSDTAFVVSPFWLDTDGKITSNYLKLIETVCKKLDLKPLGFIPNDEAILESSASDEGLPSSFVLVHLSPTSFDLSLIYLGKIKERSHYELTDSFTPADLENALANLNTDSTLPPQIIVFGQYTQATIDSLKNYTWVGKKNIETFLHFPDVIPYSLNDVFTTFLKVISNQFGNTNLPTSNIDLPPPQESEESTESINELNLVDAEVLNFSPVTPVIEPEKPIPNFEVSTPTVSPQPKIKIPHIKIKFNLKIQRLPLLILAISPLIVLAFLFLPYVEIDLKVTPYNFEKKQSITLDFSDANPSGTIPVKLKSIEIEATASTAVTGQKTVGEKATGEVTIFNQFNRTLSFAKGTVLTTESGLKFELSNNVQVTSSTANYDTGIITMGQTKVFVVAADIGQEYNLSKDEKIYLKDSGGTQILTRVNQGLTGGVKRQIQAVSAEDKTTVDKLLGDKISQIASSPEISEINNTPGILPSTVITKKQRIDYNRQIGEESTTLESSSKTTISVYYLDDVNKSAIINQFFNQNPDFKSSKYSISDFTFDFTPDKTSSDKTKGILLVKGSALPDLNLKKLSALLIGKTHSQAKKIINQFSARINDFSTTPKFPILPLVSSHIIVKIK